MKRLALTFGLVVCLISAVSAEDVKKDEVAPLSAEEKLIKNPNDAAAINKYLRANFGALSRLLNSDPDAAEKKIAAMRKLIDALKPDDAQAKQYVTRATSSLGFYEKRLEIARVKIADLKKKLGDNPDDIKALSMLSSKFTQQISPLARAEPAEAEKQLKAAKEYLETLRVNAQKDATKQLIDRTMKSFARLEANIESGKKLAALIGKDAAPLKVDAWVNGTELMDGDLKGKVVLLDFWAIWCGPCIATFPHLREWHEEYSGKGLVIVGLTRYYNYTWNADAGRPSRSQEKVAPDQEHEMLKKFAEVHNLHHRFAIQKDRGLSTYYSVSGIPHVVLIDQQGKVRLVRVGSGDKNAKDISDMLKKLLAKSE